MKNPVIKMKTARHQNEDGFGNSVSKMKTGRLKNEDGLASFKPRYVIKMKTSLIYHLPPNKEGHLMDTRMSDASPAEARVEEGQAQLYRCIKRLEARVARLEAGPVDLLTPALQRAMGDEWSTGGELWRMAEAQRLQDEATGELEHELVEALRLEGITSSHGLGRWLAAHEGKGFIRGSATNGGTTYRAAV